MKMSVHIVCEQQAIDHWTAWHADTPQIAVGGEWPSQAIERLIDMFPPGELEPALIRAIAESSRTGHLEFEIPFRWARHVFRQSVN